MATSDNCPTCDRPDCQFYTWNAGYKGKGKPPAGYIYDGAASNCYAHAVDWRTRALAVEQERDAVRGIMAGEVDAAVSHGEFDDALYARVDGMRRHK